VACELTVVVVTWNTRELLRECLTALTEQSSGRLVYAPAAGEQPWMKIVCVDNGSTDGSADMVAAEFPQVRLVRCEENAGFARGANIGINIALEHYAPRFIALVNSDLTVTPEVLAALARHLEAHPEVAVVSPRLRHPDGTLQSGAGGYAPTAWTGIVHFLLLSTLTRGWCRAVFINQRHFATRVEAVPVDWVTGACSVLRTDAIRAVGLLQEEFFMYADDVDWCCRARRAGYTVHYLPTIEAVHWQGATSPAPNPTWLASLCELVQRDRGRAEYLIFRLAAALGLGARQAAYALAYVLSRRVQYRESAHATGIYARWALSLSERRTPNVRSSMGTGPQRGTR
jgi:N-acetylglucosaminyl-diphospho-decaprenol L-rhamnosyltransferase